MRKLNGETSWMTWIQSWKNWSSGWLSVVEPHPIVAFPEDPGRAFREDLIILLASATATTILHLARIIMVVGCGVAETVTAVAVMTCTVVAESRLPRHGSTATRMSAAAALPVAAGGHIRRFPPRLSVSSVVPMLSTMDRFSVAAAGHACL